MNNNDHGPLQPSPNAIVYKDELCDFWLDDEGILCSVAKNVPRTIDLQKASFALIRKIIGNEKVCCLSDLNNIGSQDQQCRKHVNREIPNYFKALAISVNTSLGMLVANTFLTFSTKTIPIKIFDNHIDARDWLRTQI